MAGSVLTRAAKLLAVKQGIPYTTALRAVNRVRAMPDYQKRRAVLEGRGIKHEHAVVAIAIEINIAG